MKVLDKFLDAIKLNDDEYEEDDFDDILDDDFDDEELDEKPKKKFFEKFSSNKYEDDLEDDYAAEEPSPKKTTAAESVSSFKSSASKVSSRTVKAQPLRQTSSKITPMRSSKKSSAGNTEVCVIKPRSMEDTREIADTLLDNATVILNLEGIDVELAQRIIDFTSGACYSLGGSLQKVSSYIFILGPYNVDITGDLQNILSGSIPAPSIRAGY